MRTINSSDIKGNNGGSVGEIYPQISLIKPVFIVLISASAWASTSKRKQLLQQLFIINKAKHRNDWPNTKFQYKKNNVLLVEVISRKGIWGQAKAAVQSQPRI